MRLMYIGVYLKSFKKYVVNLEKLSYLTNFLQTNQSLTRQIKLFKVAERFVPEIYTIGGRSIDCTYGG